MTLSYHNLYIEISLEGIIQIESFHLAQKLNEHGNVQIKFLVEEDVAISFIEQADSNVFVCINRSDDKQQTIFQGYAEQIYIKNEQGLYYAYLNFYGFTKKWDLTNKSRSFCKSNDTYMTVIDKILSDYSEKEVKDEASEDSKIPGMLMQYEETDWEFLKRLVSHFSTFLVADNSQNFGKVYFGIPHIEQGVVLSEKEYTVLKGKEQYERLEDTGNIMPQDMMCWRIRSLKSIKFGEQVMLGHIEAVVTGVEIYTEQGELVFEYELSRRKGILTAKKKNSKIFGMSIPATVKERKGNQIRVHMDIDAEYEASDDLKYFTYAIETSNFYCMPEEESRVHIYFPDYDEQNAMAVHAISGGEGNDSKSNAVSYGANFDRAGSSNVHHDSGSGGSDYHENVTGNDIGGSSMPAAATIMPAKGSTNAQPAQPDKKETPKASKDPAYKKFSDPSGSYLELAPRGITFCPGNKLIMVKLLKTGTLTVQAENIVINTKAMLGVGISKGGPMQEISMIAQKKLNLVLGDNDSRIDMEENTRIVATFIYQEAKIKRAAQPLASVIKSNITKNDAAKREEINSSVKEDYSEIAMDIKQMLLDEKAREARAQIFDAAMTAVLAVSCVAIICCSGGTATPLVVQGAAILMGSYSVTMSISETYEGVSDLNKAANGDLSRSYNPMRDSWYGGNEELYQGIGMINNMALSMMAGNVMGSANNGRQASQMLMKYRQWCSQHKVLGTVMRGFGNALGDFAYTFARDLADNGHLDFGLSWAMTGSGLLKGLTMSLAGGLASMATKTVGGHIAATIGGQISAGIAYDFGESKVFGYEYNPYYSSISTTAASILGFLFGDPIDPVTGAYLVTSTDLILPDNLSDVKLERHYSSVNHNVGWLGRGWRFTYESRILSHGEIYYVQLPDGHCASFEKKTFISMPGSSQYKLTYDSMREKWDVMDVAHHTCYCYEKNGLLQSVIDRNGMSITFTYAGEYLLQMKTPMGETVDFEFEKGRLTALKDNLGHIITYQYEDDFLKQVVHIDGNVLQYEYTENGYLAKQIDKLGHYPLENQYDEKGRVVLQTLENGDTYSAEYRERERQTLVEYSAYPGIICYTYNKNLLIEEVKYADGSMEQFTYDDARNRVREIDRLGRVTAKKYNDIGLLVEENRPEGLNWKYHYSEHFDLESISNNAGMERRFAYDIYHNLILRRDKISEDHWSETSYGYDLRGRVLWETDGNGNTTRYSYQGEMVYPDSVIYPDGCECHFEYDRMGRKLAETDECGRTEYAYNRKNHMTMVRDGEGNETHYTYDGKGRKLSAYTPLQWKNKNGRFTSYQYDIFGRLLDTVYADGSHERLYRDGEGNIVKRVHPNSFDTGTKDGEGTCYDYDGENRLHRIHYPDGGVERFFYDSEGNLIKHVLPEQYDSERDDGEGWQYAYDEGNRLISVTGPEGITEETYEYDLQGNCVRRRDERGCSTYYAYDLLGRLVQELAPVGEESDKACYRKTTYIYDDNNNKIREIRHGGNYGADGDLLTEGEDLTLTFAYDARNRLVRVSDEQGAKAAYRYDARGNCISEEQNIRNGEGGHRHVLKKIKYAYDRAGRLTEKKEFLDSGLADDARETAITGYAYDENGNRTRIITPEGYEISRSYDDRDRLIEEKLEDKTNGIERTTRISYDKAGNVVSVRQTGKDGRSREITYDYDLKDRLIHAGELEGPVFALSYDKNDRRTEQKQLLATEEEKYGSMTFRYDIRGNLTESIQNNLSRQKYQYDLRGNLVGQTDGDGMEVTYRYGLQDEQIDTYTAVSRKQGRPAQRLTYDARGRITGVEDGCGNRTGYQSDAWGRVTAIETAEGGREEYAYDPAGNITRTTDARGGVIRYDYNSQGKVCAITDQQGNTETFRYDREGRQVQHTDRKGTVTETKYNIYGQPTLQTCTDSKGNRHVMGTWEYDDFGQLRKSVAGGFCYTYEYRPDGKLLKKWNSGKQVISCDYYRNGSLKSLTDVSGKTVYYGYDINGRLETLKDEEGNNLTEYDYTVGGRLKEIRTSNGITTAYEYDSDGNISRLTIGNGMEEGLLYDAFMLYDLNGNRLGKTGQRIGVEGKQEMNTIYCYDAMNRLTMENRREGGERYAYDLGGNRLSRQRYHYALTADGNMDSVIDDEESYCYNERNELTQRRNLLSVTEYIYDENGSLIREKEGEKETGYRYDLLNRQIHVHLPDGKEQENLYDGEGLRAGLRESNKISTFLYYNGEILAECDGESMPVRRHLTGLGLSGVEDLSTGTGHTYHQDEQGSTAYVTGTTGELENLYSYDGFGNLLEKKETIINRILYTGQQYDQETGQYYLRARFYNPVIGRFTQEDTYRGDGLNLYAYCSNNPVKYYDPSGHMQLGYDDGYNATGNTKAAELNDNISNVNGSGQGIEGGTYSSLRDLMTPEEAARYDRYWSQGTGTIQGVKEDGNWVKKIMDGKYENTRQRMYTNPGTRSIMDVKLGSDGNMYYRETIFDEFGRKIGHNDYTDHGRADHANPHYHSNAVNDPSQHGAHTPGLLQ